MAYEISTKGNKVYVLKKWAGTILSSADSSPLLGSQWYQIINRWITHNYSETFLEAWNFESGSYLPFANSNEIVRYH